MKQIIPYMMALLAVTGFTSPAVAEVSSAPLQPSASTCATAALPALPDSVAAVTMTYAAPAEAALALPRPLAPSAVSAALPEQGYAAPAAATELSAAEPVRKKQRFLPMRRRIDRKVDNIKFAYKGEVILGLTASYGTLTSEDTDYFLLLDNFNADGSITTVNPFIGYFYRDNRCVGIRFGYRHIGGTLGNLDLDLGEQNDFDFSLDHMDLTSDNFSFGVFHRSYVGLDRKGRFGLFAELELSVTTGSSDFKYKSGETFKTTYSDMFQARLSFNPGVAVYIFPNVCGTLSFGLGGIQYSRVTQKDENGVKIGSRDASKMRFRLNLANINIGMTVHLWDKKKQ